MGGFISVSFYVVLVLLLSKFHENNAFYVGFQLAGFFVFFPVRASAQGSLCPCLRGSGGPEGV